MRLGDFTTDRRVLTITGLAMGLGAISSLLAVLLLQLIAFFTNLFYYGHMGLAAVRPSDHHMGGWAALVPVAGGASKQTLRGDRSQSAALSWPGWYWDWSVATSRTTRASRLQRVLLDEALVRLCCHRIDRWRCSSECSPNKYARDDWD